MISQTLTFIYILLIFIYLPEISVRRKEEYNKDLLVYCKFFWFMTIFFVYCPLLCCWNRPECNNHQWISFFYFPGAIIQVIEMAVSKSCSNIYRAIMVEVNKKYTFLITYYIVIINIAFGKGLRHEQWGLVIKG